MPYIFLKELRPTPPLSLNDIAVWRQTSSTLEEYLWCLRMVARHMDKMGRHGMLFLAAAVSDFHVPRDKLREHKIDSSRDTTGGGEALTLHLDQVRGGKEPGGAARGLSVNALIGSVLGMETPLHSRRSVRALSTKP